MNNRPSHASDIPIEQQILLMQAINERRYYLGYELFDLPEGYEQKLTPFPPPPKVEKTSLPPFTGPCKLRYKVYQENGE